MKGVTDAGGLRSIKSMHSTGKRSMPRVLSSAYLDLYMLRKEKDRLEKEKSVLKRRWNVIQKRLRDIAEQMEMLEKSAKEDAIPATDRGTTQAKSKWKTMTLNY